MNPKHTALFFAVFVTILLQVHGKVETVSMRIVEEPTNYGWQAPQSNNYGGQQETPAEGLKMRIKPAAFSGPEHFKTIKDQCFTKILKNYKYKLCPFSNVSQYEQSIRWNPYSGILGVYQGWEIENNTFSALVMRAGDKCRDKTSRSTRVEFRCSNSSEIVSVSEPHTCHYLLVFGTPLVCPTDAMLVYPRLALAYRRRWDLLEGQLRHDEITVKGYKRELNELFADAGLLVLPEVTEQEVHEEQKHAQPLGNAEFTDLSTCNSKYKELKEKYDALKILMESEKTAVEVKIGNSLNDRVTLGHVAVTQPSVAPPANLSNRTQPNQP